MTTKFEASTLEYPQHMTEKELADDSARCAVIAYQNERRRIKKRIARFRRKK